jgi:hypothetical protein
MWPNGDKLEAALRIAVLVAAVPIALMVVSTGVICLPEVQDCARDGLATRIEHSARNDQDSAVDVGISNVPPPWGLRRVERAFRLCPSHGAIRTPNSRLGESFNGCTDLVEVIPKVPSPPCKCSDGKESNSYPGTETDQDISTIAHLKTSCLCG